MTEEELCSLKLAFQSFILHQKCLITAQFIEWHCVRREIVLGQTTNNTTYKQYVNKIDDEERQEYYYTPSKEKSLLGPKRSLCVSSSKKLRL